MKYALVLNSMLSPNIENIVVVPTSPISAQRQEVVDWYESFKVASYKDGQWNKNFAKDSPLEWYNPGEMTKDNDYWGGIYSFSDDAPDEAIRTFGLTKYKLI